MHPTNHPIDLRLVRCVCRWCLSSRSGIFLSFDVRFQWPQLADRKIHFRRGQEVKLLQLSYLVCPLLLFVWMKRVCVKIGLTDLTVANQPSCFCFGSANLRHTSDDQWWPATTQLSPLALSTMRCSVFLSAQLADGPFRRIQMWHAHSVAGDLSTLSRWVMSIAILVIWFCKSVATWQCNLFAENLRAQRRMEVPINGGTRKSSVSIGFSIVNQPFLRFPNDYGNPHMGLKWF